MTYPRGSVNVVVVVVVVVREISGWKLILLNSPNYTIVTSQRVHHTSSRQACGRKVPYVQLNLWYINFGSHTEH
jgi:hypothetical protein